MKHIMAFIKNALLWVLAVFFFVGGLAALPGLAGFLSLLTALLLVPIRRWQALIASFLKGKPKVIVTCVLAFCVFAAYPADTDAAPVPSDVEVPVISTPITVTTAEGDATPALLPLDESTPTALPTPTHTPKATAGPTPTPKPTATPTPKPTATPTKRVTASPTPDLRRTYILNTNTDVFHIPSCNSVKRMSEKNKLEFYGTREEVILKKYKPCGICHP